jgi:fluoroquinolone transport system permease protein
MGNNKYRALLSSDLRQLINDPMLMASILGPLSLLFISRYGLPPIASWTERVIHFPLSEYSSFIAIFLLNTIPILIGSLAGLLMLDERDENMISYFGVTPLSRAGYLRYRLLLPSLLSVIMAGLYVLLSGIVEVGFVEAGCSIILLMLETPLIALFLAAFASNKVEGLALSKAASLLFIGPVLAYWVPEPWKHVGVMIPAYWPAQSYLSGLSGFPEASLGWFAGGVAVHVLLLAALLRQFLKRVEQ